MSAMFWRGLIALVVVVLVFLAIPPLVELSGLAIPSAALMVARILIIGIAVFYVLRGPAEGVLTLELMTPVQKEATVQHAQRWGGWWASALVLLVVIGFVANQQLPVLMFKVSQVCIGVLLSYVADRTLFSNAPDVHCHMEGTVAGARILARAIVALAVVIGVTIGL